jgi:polysaccharide biosynthesis transport protein
MDLSRYLRAQRRWAWMLIVLPVIAAVTSIVVALALPPVYVAQVSMLVRPAQPLASSDPTVAITTDQVNRTYARLLTERPILVQLITDYGLDVNPADLTKTITVTPEPNTTILDVQVESTDRQLARDLANGLVDDFITSAKGIQQQEADQYTARIQSQLNDVADAIAKEQAQSQRLKALQHPTVAQQEEIVSLDDQLQADRNRYDSLSTNLATIEATTARNVDNLVIVSPAVLPEKPSSPRPLLDAAIALALGLVVAAGLAFVLEQLDQTVRSDEDMTLRTGLLPIGHVGFLPAQKGRRAELVTLLDNSPVVEAYKTLRTNILFSAIDHDLRTIVVTSANPGEGKSRTAANLAVVLAEAGYRTLLVDADFRRPAQHRIFGRVRNIGLANLILQDMPETELISTVERVPELWLVAAGPTPPNPSELLGSSRMRDLLQRLQPNFKFIILDTPPVNAVTDATILAAQADATLLVVEHGRTTYAALNHANEALKRVKARTIGAVINKVQASESQYYYYNYGYDYVSEETAQQRVAAGATKKP